MRGLNFWVESSFYLLLKKLLTQPQNPPLELDEPLELEVEDVVVDVDLVLALPLPPELTCVKPPVLTACETFTPWA